MYGFLTCTSIYAHVLSGDVNLNTLREHHGVHPNWKTDRHSMSLREGQAEADAAGQRVSTQHDAQHREHEQLVQNVALVSAVQKSEHTKIEHSQNSDSAHTGYRASGKQSEFSEVGAKARMFANVRSNEPRSPVNAPKRWLAAMGLHDPQVRQTTWEIPKDYGLVLKVSEAKDPKYAGDGSSELEQGTDSWWDWFFG